MSVLPMYIPGYSAALIKPVFGYKNIVISKEELLSCTTKELYTKLLRDKFGDYLVKDYFDSATFNYSEVYGPAFRYPTLGSSNPSNVNCNNTYSMYILQLPTLPKTINLSVTTTVTSAESSGQYTTSNYYINSNNKCASLIGFGNKVVSKLGIIENRMTANQTREIACNESKLNAWYINNSLTASDEIYFYFYSPYSVNSQVRIPFYISKFEILF